MQSDLDKQQEKYYNELEDQHMTSVNEEEIKETALIIQALDEYATTNFPEELEEKTYSKPAFILKALIKVLVAKNLLSVQDVRSELGLK